MKFNDKVLLVEDERRWSEIYERAVRRVGIHAVTSVATLADATKAVDSVRFAVAIVDIGLHVDDDRNADGLRVMEKIRAVGDRTSIIVVTGRSGRDVIPIVRDAIKKYDAHDTVAKSTLVPAELRELVASGLRVYELGSSGDRTPLYTALRGDVEQAIWDDMMITEAALEGGTRALYRLADTLFTPFLPLVTGQPRGVRVKDGIACGIFWSRCVGKPIVACIGEAERVHALTRNISDNGCLLEMYSTGEILRENTAGSVHGTVYTLQGYDRTDFE